MQTAPAKKMLIMNILDILKRYSDQDHTLSQKQIIDYLRQDYQMAADRKSVARNLTDLMDAGYPIECSETPRTYLTKDGRRETANILSDFYLERDFTDAELRLLIDSLLFSKHVPYSQCKELVGKLEGLSSLYFRSRTKHIRTMPDNAPVNRQLFYTIEVLDEAMEIGRQVSFIYNKYGTDKKLHPEHNAEGQIRNYVINPYQIAAANGRYYLICNYDKYDNVAHFRLDRITDIQMMDTPVKSMRKVKGLEDGLNLPKHMAEHMYMFSGESAPVTFRAKKYIVTDVLDWFGNDVQFYNETENEVTVRVTANLKAMRRWAMQYALHIKVLEPEVLSEQVKNDLLEALKHYE
ncbi:MAG: WYL domain-containing protein [Clostridiales bacterium]|nr:WYL domain-containing protein [Clostridiales bacterium]